MNALHQLLQDRSSITVAVMETLAFVTRPAVLDTLYDAHRGRCYEGELGFPPMMDMLARALIEHGGSGHRQYVLAQRDPTSQPRPIVDSSNFYRKLARTPVGVTRALLRECTGELSRLTEVQSRTSLPACFDALEVIVLDGKKIKNAARRLAPTRGYVGALLGAKALVALSLRDGLVLAMSDSLDGEANDIPLVPELLEQVRRIVKRPVLYVADRQFGDVQTTGKLLDRENDAFCVRIRTGLTFAPDELIAPRTHVDARGRTIVDEVGDFGGRRSIRVRRITLGRAGEEDVVLITSLTDRTLHGADDLLELYRHRWHVEQAFQLITETFSLKHLIGCSPRAVLLQFSLCLPLYNVTQVVKAHLARDGKVKREDLSSFEVVDETRRGMTMWFMLGVDAPRVACDAQAMRERLIELTRGRWHRTWMKRKDRKPRKPRARLSLHGGHTSVQKILEGRAKLRSKTKHS